MKTKGQIPTVIVGGFSTSYSGLHKQTIQKEKEKFRVKLHSGTNGFNIHL